ncbi:MAG: hypothetical protein P1U40_13970 [Coxiellaceae bacterium]|nr:hypothetical protein [Coxiellaceae bacterium]
MRKAVVSNQGKVDKIRIALDKAIKLNDPIELQVALDISVKTRDNSFSVANQLSEAQKPDSEYDFFTSDAFYLVSDALTQASELGADKCISYLLIVTPHEFKMLQRAMRAAIEFNRVSSLKLLLDYIGKLDDVTYIKHMTKVFMDKGSPAPLPVLAAVKSKGKLYTNDKES